MTTQSPTLASQAELPKPADRAPRLHRLKTDPEVYQAVLAGHKTFEIRLNDRDFRIGDELLLMETTATGEAIRAGAPLQFTGNEMRKHVSHVLRGYGLMPGWVCLSFACYEAGRASRAQSEWISVEDRLPDVSGIEDGETVLVANRGGSFAAEWHGTGITGFSSIHGDQFVQVTHWQPLPTPPATLGETK